MTLIGSMMGFVYYPYGFDHTTVFLEAALIASVFLLPMLFVRRLMLNYFAFMGFGTTHLTLTQRLALNERHRFLCLVDHATTVVAMIALGLYLPLGILASPY